MDTSDIIYRLKPDVRIMCAGFEKKPDKIRISVENFGKFNAINLRIEACAFNTTDNFTFHFKIDHNEFLILPGIKKSNHTKIFKIVGIAESAKEYIEVENRNIINETPEQKSEREEKEKYLILLQKLEIGELKLRIRIHCYHEYSGLGKANEKSFRL